VSVFTAGLRLHIFEQNTYNVLLLIVLQRSRALHSCFEWSIQQKPVSVQWSTSRVQLVRSCKLDIKWWQHCAHGLAIGLLTFLIASVNNMLMYAWLSVPLLYHSMRQIIKISFCVSVYVCVCGHVYGRIFQPIFTKFGQNLWGLNRKNWLGWSQNPKIPSSILAPNKNLAIANRSRVSCINTNNNNMTFKSGLEVTQGHWKWYYLKAWVRFPIRLL